MPTAAIQAGIFRTTAPVAGRRALLVTACWLSAILCSVSVSGFSAAHAQEQEAAKTAETTGGKSIEVVADKTRDNHLNTQRDSLPQEIHEPSSEPHQSVDASDDQWQPLLDEKLSGWEVFTGVPHKSVKVEGFPRTKSGDCRSGKPFGLGDPKNVFSVELVDGKPVMHVTGEIYAGLTSLEEFHNYHFSTEFKWGEKKWPPREDRRRDSGVLIHCTGEHGAFWNAWMRCMECQVQEGDCGDFIQLAGTSCQVRATSETTGDAMPKHSARGEWCTIGQGVRKWGAKRCRNHEIEGDWNRIEIVTVGDKAVFLVNGHAVMHLKNTRIGKYHKGRPLTGGKIQIQSEAAEIWYRDMKIRSISSLPDELAAHYADK